MRRLQGFDESPFSFDGVTHPVFRRGTGPGVVIMHEIPGITPHVRSFANKVAEAGFTVLLPQLFGTVNRPASSAYMASQLLRACIGREFSMLAARRSSPITQWLRALCRQLHQDIGGNIGAVGMCITGNFALSLMVDEFMMAPVLSQPSLPAGPGCQQRAGLHVSPEELVILRRRAREGAGVLGLRFTADRMCQQARFEALREEFGEGFEALEINSDPGNPHGLPADAHSVLTYPLADQAGHPTHDAVTRVLEFLKQRLC